MNTTLDLCCELIRRPSVTPEDCGCQALMMERLAAIGFECTRLQFGEVSNFWATRGDSGPIMVFAGHTDVVPTGPEEQWSTPPFEPTLVGDSLFGLAHSSGQRIPTFLEISRSRALDFPFHVFIGNMGTDHRSDLLVELFMPFTKFAQTRLAVDEVIELLRCRHSAFGPQCASLLLATLDRSLVRDLLSFQLDILVLELTSALDPVLLPRQFLVKMIQLIEWTGPGLERS